MLRARFVLSLPSRPTRADDLSFASKLFGRSYPSTPTFSSTHLRRPNRRGTKSRSRTRRRRHGSDRTINPSVHPSAGLGLQRRGPVWPFAPVAPLEPSLASAFFFKGVGPPPHNPLFHTAPSSI